MSSLNSRQAVGAFEIDSTSGHSTAQRMSYASGGLATQTIGGSSRDKNINSQNNVVRVPLRRPEVFVHVEAHELRDVTMTSQTIPDRFEAGSDLTEIDRKDDDAECDSNSWHDLQRQV
ncbi:hypothetical protein PM082_010863 [Marasmius tenuissimus]|nr:hypothetical protein PM082_010863 [Marasmius tenuissimus]